MAQRRDKEPLSATFEELVKIAKPVPRESFGKALKRIRESKSMVKPDLGKIARVSVGTVSDWERDVSVPTRSEFARIVKALPAIKYFPPMSFSADGVPHAAKEPERKPAKASDSDWKPRRWQNGVEVNRDGNRVAEAIERAVAEVEGLSPELVQEINKIGGEMVKLVSDVELLQDLESRVDLGMSEETFARVTQAWLVEPGTEAGRRARLDALRRSSTRETRRRHGLTDKMLAEARPKPPPPVMPAMRRCPRCQSETTDLKAHRSVCSKRNWEREGWRSCEAGPGGASAPHRWNVGGRGALGGGEPPEDEELRVEACSSHRKKAARDWKREGWRACHALGADLAHRWNVDLSLMRTPVAIPESVDLAVETCPDHRERDLFLAKALGVEAPRSPVPSVEVANEETATLGRASDSSGAAALTAPDSGAPRSGDPAPSRGDALDLVERCLVLADMLWPGEPHAFVLDATGKSGWTAAVHVTHTWDRLAHGEGKDKSVAVRALADALRAETKERARAASEMARLLED